MTADVISVSPIKTSSSDYHQRRRAVMVTGLIVLGSAAWLSFEAPHGILNGTDELLTAERSRETVMIGEPLVVHYNFDRSFEKPPLQYWLTSLTLPRFQNPAVALRIWPLLYCVLTAITLAWLVYLVKPDDPWLIPLAVAVLVSSPLFASESSRGLLDVGLTFFTLLTIVFTELARRKPAWWFAAAIACCDPAWPAPLLRKSNCDESGRRPFRLSLLNCAVLILFSKRERSSRAVREIAWVALGFIVLTIVTSFRHVRYVIPIIPSLCFLLAVIFYWFLQRGGRIRSLATVALALFLTTGLIHSEIRILVWRKDVANEKAIAEKLGELQQAGTEIVLIKAINPGNDLLWDSFYLFHGNLRSPVTKLTTEEIRANPPRPPLIGACVVRDFPAVQKLYPKVQVALNRAQFACWQVSAE